MQNFFLQLIEVSTIVSIIILLLLILSPLLNKRYVAKWKCMVWFLLAIRLLIPINLFPTEPLINIELPWQEMSAMEQSSVNNIITEQLANLSDSLEQEANKELNINNELNANTEFSKDKEFDINKEFHTNIESNNKIILDNTISGIWFIGVIIFVLYHGISYHIYRKNILRWSQACENKEWMVLADDISHQINLKKTPKILISKHAFSPMILGIFNPKLILPKEPYTNQDLLFILHHELTHYKRKDVLYKLILLAANAIHWFNPTVYMMFREASGDLECSCDDRVLKNVSCEGRRAYTEIIFNYILRQKINERSISTYFYGGKKSMKNRFENIMTTKPKKQGKSIFVLILCVCLCLGNLVGCSSQESAENKISQQEEKNNVPQEEEILQSNEYTSSEISEEERFYVENEAPQEDKLQTQPLTAELPIEQILPPEVVTDPLTEPPIMRLRDSLSSTLGYFEVNSGVWRWTYRLGNNETTVDNYEAGEQASKDAVEGKRKLHLNIYNYIDYTAYSIDFPVMPSYIIMKEYDLQDIANKDAEALSEEKYEKFTDINLKPDRIYEIMAEWTEEDFEEAGFHGIAYYAFVTGDKAVSKENSQEYEVWTKEEIENMDQDNVETIVALIKEIWGDEKNYVLISSKSDEFPGAFVLVVDPEVYDIEDLNEGETFQMTMQLTEEMYGNYPVWNLMAVLPIWDSKEELP